LKADDKSICGAVICSKRAYAFRFLRRKCQTFITSAILNSGACCTPTGLVLPLPGTGYDTQSAWGAACCASAGVGGVGVHIEKL